MLFEKIDSSIGVSLGIVRAAKYQVNDVFVVFFTKPTSLLGVEFLSFFGPETEVPRLGKHLNREFYTLET